MTFTESLPQLPPRCKITRRLLEQAGCEARDRGITPAEAARHAGISWPPAHQASCSWPSRLRVTCAAAPPGELYGRRGRSGGPEYGIKNLLARNLEHLTAEQFAKIIETLDASAAASRPPPHGARRRSSATR